MLVFFQLNNGLYICTSGIPGIDLNGNVPKDFSLQAYQAWSNVKNILTNANFEIRDIYKVSHYLTDRNDLEIYREVCAKFILGFKPVSLLFFVKELPSVDMKIEIQVEGFKKNS